MLNPAATPALPLAPPAPVPGRDFYQRLAPSAGWASVGMRELWAYRELFFFLTWRDIKVRYKQTLLGASWAILQPLFTMVVFSFFFGKLARIASDGVPYPIFSYTALVPWAFFAYGVTHASSSLVHDARLLKKVYFPRLILPTSVVLSGAVDFVLAFLVLLGMMAYYDIYPTLTMLWLPPLFLLAFVTSLGVGIWLTAFNVKYRDVKYIAPFLIQVWMYATPIVYPSSLLHERWRTIYGLNPMAGVIEGFRWALLGTDTRPGPTILVSSLTAVVLLVSGVYHFRHTERTIADIV